MGRFPRAFLPLFLRREILHFLLPAPPSFLSSHPSFLPRNNVEPSGRNVKRCRIVGINVAVQWRGYCLYPYGSDPLA